VDSVVGWLPDENVYLTHHKHLSSGSLNLANLNVYGAYSFDSFSVLFVLILPTFMNQVAT